MTFEAVTTKLTVAFMLRKNKRIGNFALLMISIFMISCVQQDDFSVPDGLGMEENKGLETLLASVATEISIAELKLKYTSNYKKPVLIDTDIYIKGYVSSSDKEGNFFKEVFLQDAAENPAAGIKLILNQVETYNQYNRGREVYIKLKGLYIGEERVGNGVITIGGVTATDQYGTSVKRFSENQREQHIFRSQNTLELMPLELSFSEVNDTHIGLYVQFNNVEFASDLEGKHYFDSTQDFDTLRKMQACSSDISYSYFTLETSSFAAFKDATLPTGNGSIKGVLTKTFDGNALVLGLNTLNDVNMIGSRCAPLNIDDFDMVFKEDFESAVVDNDLDITDWTNFAEKGKVKWKAKKTLENGYAEFSSAGSGNSSNIAWLITPGINMESHSFAYLNFKAAQHDLKSPKNILEVFVSTDYDGTNVKTATWLRLDACVPSLNDPWNEFIDSGLVDLSDYKGMLYIAFKATGAGAKNSTMTGTFQIDDITIFATE